MRKKGREGEEFQSPSLPVQGGGKHSPFLTERSGKKEKTKKKGKKGSFSLVM